ncbi:unnamed protein product, partial [Allacma fusca]
MQVVVCVTPDVTMEEATGNEYLQACLHLQDKLKTAFGVLPESVLKILHAAYSTGHDLFMQDRFTKAVRFYEDAYAVVETWSIAHAKREVESCNDEVCEFKPFEGGMSVYFDDIVGLQQCKQVIKEVLVYPAQHPHLCPQRSSGVLGIMLFGYPGCGKSLLAQATAAEIKAPFYNVQLSQLQSKYRGESENRVRLLFKTMRQHDVAVLFLDEFDAITGTRDGKDQMMAFKNELLVE